VVDGEVEPVAQAGRDARGRYVVITAGSFDILAEVVCENDDQLLDVISSQIRRLDGVRRPRTFVYCGCAS